LIYSSLVIVFLTLFLAGGAFAMSEGTVFRPSSMLYPLQRFTEHRRAALAVDALDRAFYLLRVAERRAYDLESLAGSQAELAALTELYTALQDAVYAVGKSPAEAQPEMKLRLAELVNKINRVLAILQVAPVESPEDYQEFHAFILALSGMINLTPPEQDQVFTSQPQDFENGEDIIPPSASTPTIEPQAVEFPDQSQAAAHTFFELTGKHTLLACESCHVDGTYAGTPRMCIQCHLDKRPEGHYEFDCFSCHTPQAWDQVIFNHTLVDVTDCTSCHLVNRPLNHYTGQCSACHQTADWLPAEFDHAVAGATDCQSCHTVIRPAKHYVGQCSACHNTPAWLPAHFNHKAAGANDCQSCHNKNRPANHFSGQCSSCHRTIAWIPATFNHSGNADCQSCHKPPANHWPGNCSNCHSPSGWGKISVQGHSFPMNHGNADGECADCHSSNSPSVNCYKCHNQAKMEQKHGEEGIFNIAGRCLSCHPNGEEKDD
jgi:hypothetical protein